MKLTIKGISLFVLFFFSSIGTLFSQNLQIADYLSAPYCSQVIKSTDGSRIAWLSEQKGTRTIYVGVAPNFEAREVFSSDGDDGQVIGNMQFAKDNTQLFFVHGSGHNKEGVSANPASFVDYPIQQLKSIDLGTVEVTLLGKYSNYLLSHDGQHIFVPSASDLYKINIKDRIATKIITMRGTFSDLKLSKDNQKILFTSNRGDHSYIGIYTIGEKSIQWLSPGVDRDHIPEWSPDESKIAFIRAPGTKKGELRNIMGGIPFQIMVHDLLTKETKVIWKSPSDDGGFAQYYFSNPLNWSTSNKIWFYSEHEGWMNIYTMNPDGSQLESVIKGKCEVEQSIEVMSGDAIIFSTNCGDIDRRDIYQYNFSTKQTNALTDGDAIETHPVMLKDGQLIYRQGGTNYPTRITKLYNQQETIIFPKQIPASFPSSQHVIPKQVLFTAADGTKVHGQLFTKDQSGSKPGILFMHGGPIRQMLLGYHYSSYYAFAYAMNQYLAQQGYAVISVNFRAGIGYGKDFRRAEKQGPRGASEYADIVAAAKYLQDLPYVNADRIGLWGGSYGGFLTAMGLARNSDIFKAGVDLHGVHDWNWRATDFSPGGSWGIDKSLMNLAYKSSPVSDLSKWTSPVLFIHGDDDRNVMYGQTVDLVQRLRERNVEHELLVFPDEVHGFYRFDSWLRTYEAAARFFDRHLK